MTLPSNAWAAPRATQRPLPGVTELLLTLSITHAKHHTTSKAPTHWSNPYSSLISLPSPQPWPRGGLGGQSQPLSEVLKQGPRVGLLSSLSGEI